MQGPHGLNKSTFQNVISILEKLRSKYIYEVSLNKVKIIFITLIRKILLFVFRKTYPLCCLLVSNKKRGDS